VKRNLLLIFAVVFALFLMVNSARRIVTFRGTSEKVGNAEKKLVKLLEDNKELKLELEYKKGEEFKEMEIRNKLGLVKEGEAIVIIPKEDDVEEIETLYVPNWVKWRELFFGDS